MSWGEGSKTAATREARKLVKKLGKGWRICVWENLGWHYCAEALDGHLTVWDEGGEYHVLFSPEHKHTGNYDWYDEKRFRDPRKAVKHLLALMEKHTAKILRCKQTIRDVVSNFP